MDGDPNGWVLAVDDADAVSGALDEVVGGLEEVVGGLEEEVGEEGEVVDEVADVVAAAVVDSSLVVEWSAATWLVATACTSGWPGRSGARSDEAHSPTTAASVTEPVQNGRPRASAAPPRARGSRRRSRVPAHTPMPPLWGRTDTHSRRYYLLSRATDSPCMCPPGPLA